MTTYRGNYNYNYNERKTSLFIADETGEWDQEPVIARVPPISCDFHIYNYTLDELPNNFRLEWWDDKFFIDNVNCLLNDPVNQNCDCVNRDSKEENLYQEDSNEVIINLGCGKDKPKPTKCWCDFIEQMIETGEGNCAFVLEETPNPKKTYSTVNYVMKMKGYFHDDNNRKVKLKTTLEERKEKWNKLNVNIEIDFEYESSYSRKEIVELKFKDAISGKLMRYQVNDYSIYKAKFEIPLERLPEEFLLQSSTFTLRSTSMVVCKPWYKGSVKPLCNPPETGQCYCNLINSLRSSGRGEIKIPMRNTKGAYAYANCYAKIIAIREENDHNKIILKIEFDHKTAYESSNYHYNNYYAY